ncbi:hypothetical protein Tco_0901146 [Tanacetum coccineum]
MFSEEVWRTREYVRRTWGINAVALKSSFTLRSQMGSAAHKIVFSTWMAFGGNTRDLSSFGEETDKITNLHQIHEEVLFTEREDGVAGIKRRPRDPSSDGVRDLVTASGCGQLKEDLESST